MRRGERPVLQLPRVLLLGFVVLFGLQLGTHYLKLNQSSADYRPLSEPLSVAAYQGVAMDSAALAGYLLAIRLQLHDNQLGRHFRYSLMDYHLLVKWLETISAISPGNEYPMMLASRVYASTRDPQQLRLLIAYIERVFEQDPQLYWRRVTEASLIAKHQIGDLELALRLAEKVASQPPEIKMPPWARDFRFLLLAELNEFESAIAIIQALLKSEAVQDADEKRFLHKKLSSFRQKLFEFRQSDPGKP